MAIVIATVHGPMIGFSMYLYAIHKHVWTSLIVFSWRPASMARANISKSYNLWHMFLRVQVNVLPIDCHVTATFHSYISGCRNYNVALDIQF
jgi:hypothetical protein